MIASFVCFNGILYFLLGSKKTVSVVGMLAILSYLCIVGAFVDIVFTLFLSTCTYCFDFLS